MGKMMAKTKQTNEYDGSTPLKNVMQEWFVTKLLQGMHQNKAYVAAGYKTKKQEDIDANASRLTRNDKVRRRLEYKRGEILRRVTEEVEITIAGQIKEFQTNLEIARSLGQTSAANAALVEQGRLAGLYEKDNEQKAPKMLLMLGAPKRVESKVIESVGNIPSIEGKKAGND